MSKEYIDKSALYEKIAQLEKLARNRYLETPSSSLCFSRYMTQLNERTALKHIVADFPSADVAPVRRGRWIEEDGIQICSECGEEHEWEDYRAPYCDTCGAKMAEKAVKEEACQNGGN